MTRRALCITYSSNRNDDRILVEAVYRLENGRRLRNERYMDPRFVYEISDYTPGLTKEIRKSPLVDKACVIRNQRD